MDDASKKQAPLSEQQMASVILQTIEQVGPVIGCAPDEAAVAAVKVAYAIVVSMAKPGFERRAMIELHKATEELFAEAIKSWDANVRKKTEADNAG